MKNLVKTEIAVKTEILSSEDGNRTYSIKKEITGIAGSHAYFILLYPTRTQENCYVEDSTNNHLLNHFAELGLNSYTIINLFAQVTQSRLSLAGLTVNEENMNYINDNIGVHPLFLGIRHSQSYWKLVEYPRKKILKELLERMKPKKNEKETKSKATEKNSAKGKKDNSK